MSKRMRWWRAGCGALVLSLILGCCGFYGTCRSVRESVVRLHILANSDSDADQQLKLQVRDAVTAAASGWMDGVDDAAQALELAREQLPLLQAVAEKTVRDAGYDYPVKAELCRTYFTTRQYDAITLPAGMYDAVRLTIGAGAGHNWWCVVFPPMCLGAATDPTTLTARLGKTGQALVTDRGGYVVRFKIVEAVERWLYRLRGKD